MKEKYIRVYNNIKLLILLGRYLINKLYSDNYIKIYFFIFMPLLLISNLYFSCEILLCDDRQDSLPHGIYYRDYVSDYRDKPLQYQPYRPGLQQTTEGYRFELPADQPTSSSSYPPMVRVELNGRLIYAQYSGQDYLGNPMYTYDNQNFSIDSTRIGLIEPTRSEVLNEGYYPIGTLGHKDLYTTKYNSKPGFWNKIKSDFKSARESAGRDKNLRINQESSIVKDVRSSRAGHDMLRQSHRNHRSDYYNYYNRKVRRFD